MIASRVKPTGERASGSGARAPSRCRLQAAGLRHAPSGNGVATAGLPISSNRRRAFSERRTPGRGMPALGGHNAVVIVG